MSALNDAIKEWRDVYGWDELYDNSIIKIIEQGANVNEPDEEGNTPLMLAIIKELSPVQIELMRRGADLHARDRLGRTSLMLALDNASYNCVDEFIWQYEQIGEKPQIDFAYEQGRWRFNLQSIPMMMKQCVAS